MGNSSSPGRGLAWWEDSLSEERGGTELLPATQQPILKGLGSKTHGNARKREPALMARLRAPGRTSGKRRQKKGRLLLSRSL